MTKTVSSILASEFPCPLCEGNSRLIYHMNGYRILQCDRCLTGRAHPTPSKETLKAYYDGFLFQAKSESRKLYLGREIEGWLRGLGLPPSARMLDVGGGGGFMAHAFKTFGMGEAHYLDLDAQACEFAQKELGIPNAICTDAQSLVKGRLKPFDLIYCRHVLEHMPDPGSVVHSLINLLAPNGKLVIIVPNGISWEYLAYPGALRDRARKIRQGNVNFSWLSILGLLCSNRITHGMDPIRHLWSFTETGFRYLFSKVPNSSLNITTAFLDDPVYSMYSAKHLHSSLGIRMRTNIINNTFGRIHGGCHLVANIINTSTSC